jgi:hypothetical protein
MTFRMNQSAAPATSFVFSRQQPDLFAIPHPFSVQIAQSLIKHRLVAVRETAAHRLRRLKARVAFSTIGAMPPRRAKSQSISSDTSPTLRSPLTKSPTPAKPGPRRSLPASPVRAAYNAIADPVPKSQIAAALRFPLVVILSFSLSSLLFSIVAEITAGDLAAISKHTESWVEITGLLGWKVVQLAVCWFGGFDGMCSYETSGGAG